MIILSAVLLITKDESYLKEKKAMKAKKFISLFLATVMVLSLAACGESGTE